MKRRHISNAVGPAADGGACCTGCGSAPASSQGTSAQSAQSAQTEVEYTLELEPEASLKKGGRTCSCIPRSPPSPT